MAGLGIDVPTVIGTLAQVASVFKNLFWVACGFAAMKIDAPCCRPDSEFIGPIGFPPFI
jgi:hypothetical protein